MNNDLSSWVLFAIMGISYLFITVKAFEWLVGIVFRQWVKRRKMDDCHRAVDRLCTAFELDEIKSGDTMRITTKDNLIIFMYRTKD